MNYLWPDDNPTITNNSILEQGIVNVTEITKVRPFEVGIFKYGANYVRIFSSIIICLFFEFINIKIV
ncbi:hypothetical protein A6769_04935 [Nostoc punctiforme NIES-2108]|uniref:Uncharacterized protein n=1 Tax=Nostoc punctiforme NIES-2108 TaxID=1356359 RepID=A0A367RTM5_NOSPU|nr:hypothetical protein A6769_04935 [Nostoc punctiforme NIES-2108]